MIDYFRALIAKLRGLFWNRNADREFDDEVETHLRLLTERYVRQGMTEGEADRAARRQFGNVTLLKEAHHDMRGIRFIETLVQDLRYGLWMMRRNPGFTLVAALTLALGVGANTVIFSLINTALLQSLPFRDPSRLVAINNTHPEVAGNVDVTMSYLNYRDLKEQSASFQDMAIYSPNYGEKTLLHNGEPDVVNCTLVSHNLFSLMGVRPQYGRDFLSQEDQPGQDRAAVLSHRLWVRRFGADPGIVGENIQIDNRTFSVIGILNEQDQFPADTDVWLPLSLLPEKDMKERSYHRVTVIARLKPEVDEKQAAAEIKSIARRLEEAYPESNKNLGMVQVGLLDYYTRGIRAMLMVLLGATGLVMLIACANIANLLLARAANRRKEMAIRAAHGAARLRLFRQLLTESLLLAVLGAVGGTLIAYAGTASVGRWAYQIMHIPRMNETSVDTSVLLYAAGVSVFTGLLFGTLPAIQGSQLNLNEALKQSGRSAQTSMQGRLRNMLIVAEVAIAVIVLIGAGLLIRSLTHLLQVNPGFRIDNLLAVDISLPKDKYPDYGSKKVFYDQLLGKVKSLPGVKDAATINILHIVPSGSLIYFGVEGMSPRGRAQYPLAQARGVSPNYFDLMNIPIREGRQFQDPDAAENAPRAVIINETLARSYFRNQSPIGKKILMADAAPKLEGWMIVGVVADVKDLGVDRDPQPEIYFPGYDNRILLAHTTVDPLSLAPAIRQVVKSIDPSQPIAQARRMRDILDESLSRRKFPVDLMTLFSALALILSAIGIYSVMSYSVVQRTSEIGIRMALGADRANIVSLLLKQAMAPVAVGLAFGLLGAWSLKSVLSSLLYGVSSTDLVTYVIVIILIISAAVIATLLPSHRATEIDPLMALRQE
jgi:putative ABC transport system permease protein